MGVPKGLTKKTHHHHHPILRSLPPPLPQNPLNFNFKSKSPTCFLLSRKCLSFLLFFTILCVISTDAAKTLPNNSDNDFSITKTNRFYKDYSAITVKQQKLGEFGHILKFRHENVIDGGSTTKASTTTHVDDDDVRSWSPLLEFSRERNNNMRNKHGHGNSGNKRNSTSSRSRTVRSPHLNYLLPSYKCSSSEQDDKSAVGTVGSRLSTINEYLTCSNSNAYSFNETITIGFLSPYSQNPFSLGAMRLAVEMVNNDPDILPGRTLKFMAADIGSSELMLTSLPIRIMTEMRDQGTVAFIGGPEDTCVSEALVSSAWNLPMISYKCSDHRVSDKSIYPTFARTLPPSSKVSKSVVQLLRHFKWDKIVLVVCHSKKDRRFRVLIDALNVLATDNGINITDQYSIPDFIPISPYLSDMEKLVADSYERTRVYVFIGEHVALVYLVKAMAARHLFDKGEYVIISIDDKLNLTKFFDLDYLDPFLQNGTEDMLNGFRSVLKLMPSHPQTKNFGEIMRVFRNYSTIFPFCVPYHPFIFPDAEVPVEAAYLYDAVKIYARALTEALADGDDPRNGTSIFQRIRNRSYISIQGYDVLMDGNGDAEGNYTVIALMPQDPSLTKGDALDSTYDYWNSSSNSSVPMAMQPVGYFQQGTNTSADDMGIFRYYNEPIRWVGKEGPPKSEPPCGFNWEKCQWKPDWKTIVVCSVFGSILMVAIILAARHYRYEQKLACLLWKIDMKDVIMIPSGPPEPCNGTKSTVALCRQLLGTAVDTDAPLELACKKAYTRIGFYKGNVVAIKPIYKRSIDLTRNIRKELKQIREIRMEHIVPFIGASVDHGNICILTAYSARGSLEDVLQNEDLHLDKMFLASLVFDLIKGMIYLHDSEIISHGNLKSSNCLVDSRWVLQITDFGLHDFRAGQEIRRDPTSRRKEEMKLLWRAPELLRDPNKLPRGTQKGDVYSFGIILYELIGRVGPWGKTLLSVSEIIDKVANPVDNCILRPPTKHLDVSDTVLKCLHACWEEDAELRPDFRYIRVRLKEMQTGLKPNIFDNMLSIMEKYACNLEDLVQERTTQLMEEKKKTDALLHRMLPKSVADSLKRGEPVEAESFDSVTIYFSDIVGFTALSAVSTPMQVVELLNDLYTCFDSIISNYDVYKVETIGDAYMVVSGLPIRNGNQHAGEVASMALTLRSRIQNFEIRHRPGERLKLRIGIHSGPVVTGVVGLKMPRYCLFGDTVNTASRMESSGEALKIHISDVTKALLETLGGYDYEERGIIPIKGKGEMRTYWLTGEDLSKTRRNSREEWSVENPRGDPLLTNNNCSECSCGNQSGEGCEVSDSYCPNNQRDANGVLIGNHANCLLNMKLYKPTTWLLAECNNGKLENGSVKKAIGGRYVSCSNVFQECKASIIKELKKTGSVSANQSNRFRSAPIITFIDTSNPYNGNPGFPYEEPKFV